MSIVFLLPNWSLAQNHEEVYVNLQEILAGNSFEGGENDADLAVIWARRLSDTDPASAVRLLNGAGVFYINIDDAEVARGLLQDAVELSQQAYGDGHPLVISSLSNLAVAYRSLGRFGEAREKIEEALRWARELYGDSHPRIGEIRNNLAAILLGAREYEQAIVEASTAISIESRGDEFQPEWRIAALTNLGIAQMATGSFEAALESVMSANEFAEASGNNLILADARVALGQVYRAIGEQERADTAFDLAAGGYLRMGVPQRGDVGSSASPEHETITIATVYNSAMIIMQNLSSQWEEATGHKIEWVVLEENVLRQRVTIDIATGGGQFDIITIGSYEVPIWGAQGWLVPVDGFGEDYDYDDIFESVRAGLNHDGTLYAVPIYAESSVTFYRSDLFEEVGLEMPEQPTYDEIREFAEKLHDPQKHLYGICLRGKPGWGGNMAFVSTMVNAYGGRWFDEDWQPQLTSNAWVGAISDYVELMNNFGPPGASSYGYSENLANFASGNCAMWVDSTFAASYLFNPNESRVADSTSVALAPKQVTDKGAGWFWSNALAIPSSSQTVDVAQDFIEWATSKEYVALVGETEGWFAAPPGTRQSTYELQEYRDAAPFAELVRDAMLAADPSDATLEPVPYTGIQYVAIPEFQGIATEVGQAIAAALTGQMTVEQALENAQRVTERTMRQAGYLN